MASNEDEVLTYHVVPRFDVAAEGGPLALGIILDDLKYLIPLNRKPFLVDVPDELKYKPVTQTEYKDTLARVRAANVKGWAKVVGLPVDGSVTAGASKGLEKTVSCDSIVTTYFDPDPSGAYFKECLAKKPIQEWLQASENNTAELYLVTGLKVAKALRFNKSSSSEQHADVAVRVKGLPTDAVDAGITGDAKNDKKQELEFTADDIVIAYRVNRYQCIKKWFSRDRTIKNKGVLNGNMMDDNDSGDQLSETVFTLLPIQEEAATRAQAVRDGAKECFVPPSM
ncbi:hypothetical protein AUP68_02596 [Ilyonectria robusta]